MEVLSKMLTGASKMTAASSAIGLARLMTDKAIRLLIETARAEAATAPVGPRNPLRVAVIGALETVVDANRFKPQSSDQELAEVFDVALETGEPLTRAVAASALGKMGRVEASTQLQRLFEAPDHGRSDLRTMRSSAAYALD